MAVMSQHPRWNGLFSNTFLCKLNTFFSCSMETWHIPRLVPYYKITIETQQLKANDPVNSQMDNERFSEEDA